MLGRPTYLLRTEIKDEQICICPKTAKEFQPATMRYSSHMTNGILLTPHNQEVTQWSPDPFSRERVGSGHETRSPDHFSRERVGSGHKTRSPNPFSRERVGSGHETRSPDPFSRERVGSGHETNT